ncbi:MAG: DUF6600 domain-containing protein [Verrucomicrobiota bacterium]
MKKYWSHLAISLAFALSVASSNAGTIFYQAIPAVQSDANCGISTDNQYTSAVDGGNTRGPNRVINGITLSALAANGQSAAADNCTVNALAGSLSNAGGASPSIQADGTFKETLSDMTFNNGATDNSQQEIVLDPESLEAEATYDLRIYIANPSGQNRQVNLSFVGDGQAPVETGFFNEDDARTSAGGFKDPNQTYYINYRFTWDGDSTPGVTVTQKSGSTPFVLYALTNQLVPSGTAAGEAGAQGSQTADNAGGGESAGGDEGLTSGLVNQESDEVGVDSDDFYNSESLNNNGRWISAGKWKRCWQPTNVPAGWCPYTNGKFSECDDCGWTFDSDEPWAWACYHYGRWCKVSTGCNWAWVPGKVWAGSWVSWRRGRDESGCSCIGWAPLPPEAGCEVNVGISSWVDESCNIGPECYTFIHIRDFGSSSYFGCGCIYERERNTRIIIDTFNCTNICYNKHVNIYCGGPEFSWCNREIKKYGGKECEKIHVNRYDDPGKMGGKFSKHEGNQLGLMSPHIKGEKNSKHLPKTAESLSADKIGHGWGKDKKAEKEAKNYIAKENGGKNSKNTKATLPADVASQMKTGKHGSGNENALNAGGNLHPGGKHHKGVDAQNLTTGGQDGAGSSGFNQHPLGKGKNKGQIIAGSGTGAGTGGTSGFDQHPGKNHKGRNATNGSSANALGAGGSGKHPGQSFKGLKSAQGGTDQGTGGTGKGGKHRKQSGQTGTEMTTQGATGQGATGQGTGGTGKGSKHRKQSGQTGTEMTTQGATGQGTGGTGKGSKRHKQSGQTDTEMTTQGATGQGATGQGTGGTGKGSKHHKQSGQTANPMMMQGSTGQVGGGGGGGGGKHHKQQQIQQFPQSQGQGGQSIGQPQPKAHKKGKRLNDPPI